MAIKVIVELQAKPGKRDELKSLIESIVANHGPASPVSWAACATRCSITPTSWLRSPIGSRPRRGWRTCRKLWPPASMHL